VSFLLDLFRSYCRFLSVAMHGNPKRRLSHNIGSNSSHNSQPAKRSKSLTSPIPLETQHPVHCELAGPSWPAPKWKIEDARTFIKECAKGKHLTLLVPDKDGEFCDVNLSAVYF